MHWYFLLKTSSFVDAPPPPSSLTLLKATQTTLHLRIGTSLPSYVPPYQQYEVQQRTGFFGNWETSTCEIHENEVYIVKLSAKTKYNIRIRGQNRNDWSAYSHAFEFKTTNEKGIFSMNGTLLYRSFGISF